MHALQFHLPLEIRLCTQIVQLEVCIFCCTRVQGSLNLCHRTSSEAFISTNELVSLVLFQLVIAFSTPRKYFTLVTAKHMIHTEMIKAFRFILNCLLFPSSPFVCVLFLPGKQCSKKLFQNVFICFRTESVSSQILQFSKCSKANYLPLCKTK